MNKRQKKKLYKRLYGHNPPKTAPAQQPSISFDFSGTAEAAQVPSGSDPLPCTVTAESLTAQRMVGKRRKKNHKKRRI